MSKKIKCLILVLFSILTCLLLYSCKEETKAISGNRINIANLPTSGTFVSGGYSQDTKVLNFFTGGENDSGSHSLGVLDLRKYKQITIYYGTDSSAKEIGKLALKTAKGIELTSVQCSPAAGWNDTTNKVEIDIEALRNKEEIILSLTDAVSGIAVNKIELHFSDNYGIHLPVEEDLVLSCGKNSDISVFYEKNKNEYESACKYYKDNGFSVYNSNEKNGNCFTTLTKGDEFVHIYWIECESEMNIIYSPTNGNALPSKEPQTTTGNTPTTVTQIKGNGEEVMGYIIQLADGSFIVYDGGNASCAEELINTLNNKKAGNEILIRAWVLTVNDDNHIGCFKEIAANKAGDVKLETVIAAPVDKSVSAHYNRTYLSENLEADAAKFSGAKVCYAYTGMEFTFCNVKMEILFTAEELYVSDPPREDESTGIALEEEFGNTSLISRICTENTKMLMLSDCGIHTARRMAIYYREYLKSDICQAGQHGQGDIPLYIYNMIAAPILYYPTTTEIYNTAEINKDVREVLGANPVTQKVILLDSQDTVTNLDNKIKATENTKVEALYQYTCLDGETISYYYDVTEEEIRAFCDSYIKQGYTQYIGYKLGDNLSMTVTKGMHMIHIYWYAFEKRMMVVDSPNGANSLPLKALDGEETKTGEYKTTVTQLKSTEINGMGYVIQLTDGSFIIYDGGYDKEDITQELWSVLNDMTKDEDPIIIRAWVLTHPHADHYGTFVSFSNKYAKEVKLETVMVAPITEKERAMQQNDGYMINKLKSDVARFEGAKICNVFPGMVFEYCGTYIEILGTYHDSFVLSTVRGTSNNTCIISRFLANNQKMLFLADAGMDQAEHLLIAQGDYIKSTMCQVSHHGVEDCPLIVYRAIEASTLWYPCNTELYELKNRDADVRQELKESIKTENIYLHDTRITKIFG